MTERDGATAGSGERSRRRTVGLVAGLFVLSTAAGAYEIAPASVLPLVRESLGVGATAAGWLVSVMYLTAVVASVPVGAALDRVSVRRAVAAAALALLVAGGWGWAAAVAGAYWWLFASRILGGFAYVVFWNAGANLVGQAVDAEVRATAVGVFTASAPVGFALGQFGSPLVAEALGWEAALPTFAALAVVGVAVFLLATRGRSLAVEADAPSREEFAALFRNRAAWTLCILSFLGFSLYLFLNSWLPSYLTDSLGVSLAAGGLLTALFPAVGVVSRTGGGVLSDRLFGGKRRPVALLSFAAAAPAVAGFVAVSSVAPVVALVVVSGFAVQLALGLFYTYVVEVVSPAVRTTAVSMLTSVGLLGAFLAPIVGGEIIARAGYRPAFLLATGVAVLGAVLSWYAPEVR
ncbi:MFS transporter (plasmid) [Halorussus salilacus]|uniref:MFS transporter n=1 Tax=Halorussus salilacus TaxID=2953750 RepID=UPI00209E00BF|nr:MFS transporter [Halorussus salilacus]USZ69986.1 MFS transporter [Halorussus salilacus]